METPLVPLAHPSPRTPRPVVLFTCDAVLDAAGAARAIHAFRNVLEAHPIIWLDLSAVRRLSRAAVAVLSGFAEGPGSRAATLRLIGVPPAIRAGLRGTPLERYLWQPPPSFGPASSPAA